MIPKVVVREQGFNGYNDNQSPEFIPRGYLADAVNCFIRNGDIVKRPGYTLIGNDPATGVAVQGLRGGQFSSGTKIATMVSNGNIYIWTGLGSWTIPSGGSGVLATTGLVDIVFANDNIYYFDGVNTVPKYNGSVVSTVAAIPIGKYAKWFHNQMSVAGITATPNRLKTSEIGDPETYAGGNTSSLDVNPNDGDIITGLCPLKDSLIVSKRNAVWVATGFGTSALTLAGVSQQGAASGTLSHFSMISVGNTLWYMGYLGDRPHIRSLTRTFYGTIVDGGIISDDIEGTMQGLNATTLTSSCATFDGKFLWFSVANGSSTTNNLVLTYNTINKGWTRQTGINASCFDVFTISNQQQLYFGEATATSKVYVYGSGTSDNGAAIAFSVSTRRYGGEKPDLKKKYQWLYLTAKETGNYTLTVDYSIDGFTYGSLGTMNLGGTGTVFDAIVLDTSRLGATDINKKRFTIPKSRHYYSQYKFYDSSAVSSVTIRNWELYYYNKHPISTVHS